MFYRFAAAILYPIVMLRFRLKIIGRERIPDGAAIFCANHSSLWDPVLIGVGLSRRKPICFMAKSQYLRKLQGNNLNYFNLLKKISCITDILTYKKLLLPSFVSLAL